VIEIPLTFDSKFQGHGNEETWRINGKSYPETDARCCKAGKRYRLVMKNLSTDDHPIHLHRHTFEVRASADGSAEMRGLMKDVVLVPGKEHLRRSSSPPTIPAIRSSTATSRTTWIAAL
jgi:FtsP/CotA-like multicopper oxidase with cupredoxin domain